MKKIAAGLLAATMLFTHCFSSFAEDIDDYCEENEDWEQYVNENDNINATDSIECPYRVFYEDNGALLREFYAKSGTNYKPFSVLYLGGIKKELYDRYMSGVLRDEPFSVDIMFQTEEGSLYVYSTCERKYASVVQKPGAYVDSNYSIQMIASLEPFEHEGEMIYAFTIYDEGIDELLTEQVRRAKQIIDESRTCTVYVQAGDEVVDAYGHIGEYTAPVTSYFATDIASLKTSEVTRKQYKGLPIEPAVTIKDALYRLKEGTDYTIRYENNDSIGAGIIILTGKGRYTGEIIKLFNIVPKTVKLKAKTKKNKLTLKWASAGDVDKYYIYRSTDGGNSYKKVYTAKGTTLNATISLKSGLYRIRSVKRVNGKKYYSEYSKPLEI